MNRIPQFSGEAAYQICRHLTMEIGERVQGLKNTHKTKEYLEKYFTQIGLEQVHSESFSVLTSHQEKAKINVGSHSFEALSFGLSGTTGDEGIAGPIAKLTSWSWNPTVKELAKFSGKIVVIYSREITQETFKQLIESGVRGIVYVTYHPGTPPKLPMGFIYAALKTPDIDSLPPIVSVNYEDGAWLLANATKLSIYSKVDILPSKSFNIMGEIPGKNPEVILLSAHYDSVPYSPGAADNASGTAILLELAKVFAKSDPQWTLRFIACGSEECALQGARHYCETHQKAITDICLNLNFDVHGARIGNLAIGALSSRGLQKHLIRAVDHWKPEIRFGPTGGDNRIFAYHGIPALHWWFGGGINFLLNHTPKDTLQIIAPDSLHLVGTASEHFIYTLNQRHKIDFPIPLKLQKKNAESIQSLITTTRTV